MLDKETGCLSSITDKPMSKILFVIPFLISTCFPSLCGSKDLSVETRAYENAVGFLKGTVQALKKTFDNYAKVLPRNTSEDAQGFVKGPSEAIWDKSLVVLARSPSREGDKYLARLAFFVVDAGGGEDFSCATWYRGKHHRKEFLKHLREARDHYDTMSPCLAPEFKEEKREPALQCKTKDQYARLVQLNETPESKEEDKEATADCSHMFKPRKR